MTDEFPTHPNNLFEPRIQAKYHVVAEKLLECQPVTFDELKAHVSHVLGADIKLSPRSFAVVLRSLEDQEITVLRQRDKVYGTVYLVDFDVPFKPEFRLSKPDGSDATRDAIARRELELELLAQERQEHGHLPSEPEH